jgi:hypothetical protein
MTDVQFVTGIVNRCGDIEFFFFHDDLSFKNISSYIMKIVYIDNFGKQALKKPILLKGRTDRVTTLLRFSLTEKTSASIKILSHDNG